MKKKYSTPKVKMVDFSYDDQVTATSTKCQNFSEWGLDNPTWLCNAELKGIPYSRMYSECYEINNEW